jgi:hypothetical protein
MAVVVTYYSDEWRKRSFNVLADGEKIGTQVIEKGGVPRFFDVEYPLPAGLVKDRKKVTVKFEATDGKEIAGVYGVRMIRSDAAR